jgi:hypothetical protein
VPAFGRKEAANGRQPQACQTPFRTSRRDCERFALETTPFLEDNCALMVVLCASQPAGRATSRFIFVCAAAGMLDPLPSVGQMMSDYQRS